MTCIVATTRCVWADRRVSDGGSRFRPTRKVVRGRGSGANGALVAAFCGTDAKCAKAMAAVRAGVCDVHALAEISDGVVVTRRGRWELTGGAAIRVPSREPIITQGSGWSEVHAYLYGAGRFDDETIRKALRYVARVRTDCGDGIDAAEL